MQEKHNRDFKGVWIPKEVWLDRGLTIMEKVFLVEIDSLDNERGCYASNTYFARFFNVTPQRCSQVINSLIKKKVIKATYTREGKEIVLRVLNIFTTYKGKFKKVLNKGEEGIKESLRRYKENVKDNSTSNKPSNSTSNSMEIHFEPLWSNYPSRVNKKDALRHFNATVKCKEDVEKITSALENYKNSKRVKDGFIQNGSTWFNNWQDWIDFKEPVGDKKGQVKTDKDWDVYEKM
jgi:hypothetical protein